MRKSKVEVEEEEGGVVPHNPYLYACRRSRRKSEIDAGFSRCRSSHLSSAHFLSCSASSPAGSPASDTPNSAARPERRGEAVSVESKVKGCRGTRRRRNVTVCPFLRRDSTPRCSRAVRRGRCRFPGLQPSASKSLVFIGLYKRVICIMLSLHLSSFCF